VKPFPVLLSILCFFLFVLPQCTHFRAPVPVIVYQACAPPKILLEIKEGKDVPAGLKGIAKIKVESPDKKFSVKEIIIAKRPGCLRLETLSPLGQPEFFAVTDGSDLFFFSPSENKFYRGITSPEHVSRFIPLNLSLEEMVSLILGKVPLIDYDPEQVKCAVEGVLLMVNLCAKDGDSTQTLKVDTQNKRAVGIEIYGQERSLTLAAEYGNYQKIGETIFPLEISISMPQDGSKVKISFKTIEFPSVIDPGEFKLIPPQGVEVLPLE